MASTEPSSGARPDHLERLYRDEFASMARLAHLLTGSNQAAEDIAQEAFLRVEGRVLEVENPTAYLRATVVNLSKNWQRSGARRSLRERRTVGRQGTVVIEVGGHDELLAVIDELPFRQRAVLVARYWLDLPEAEIAALVGCRPGTVKSLNSRALAALRRELS